MAFTVDFYSFAKRENSTLLPSGTPGLSVSCEIKDDSTLTEPVLELNIGSSVSPAYSYAHIADFGRYYFVREWQFRKGLWYAYLSCDVLASFKSEIGAQQLYVTRSSSAYDGSIKDMYYPTKSTSSVTDAVISDNGVQQAAVSFTQGYFVVEIIGNNTASGSSVYYQMTPAAFQDFVAALFVAADGYQFGDLLQGVKNSIMNPMQYVAGVRWYPYSFNGSSVTTVSCGLWSVTGLSGVTKLSGTTAAINFSVSIPKHPLAATRGEYMSLSPYSRYYLEWGQMYALDDSLMADESQIIISIDPDFTSNIAILRVCTGSNLAGDPLLIAAIPYGQEIPLSANMISPDSLVQLISGGAEIAAGAMTGDLAAMTAGAGSAVQGVAEVASGITSIGSSGGAYNIVSSTKRLKAIFYDVVDDDLADFGRPLMAKRTLSTLSGFIKCQNEDISISCLEEERRKIRSYLTGGFFYE